MTGRLRVLAASATGEQFVEGDVRVRAVDGPAALDRWIEFPRTSVYPPPSLWVPPLDRDLRRVLSRRHNPFFRHGVGVPLLATNERGEVLGRILAHVYHRHNVRHGEQAAFFGYFECRGNPAAARALVTAAARFGARHGCTLLRGPFNMTAMQEMGVLLGGFDEPPALDETFTAPYYPALLEAAGLHSIFPVTTFRIDELSGLDPTTLIGPRQQTLFAAGRLRIRQANLNAYDREIETLRELLNDSFYDNPHFVPITREEFLFQVGPLNQVMDPRISLVAEMDGVPCGFVLALPDFNPILRRMQGRLGLRDLLRFPRERRRVRDAALIIMGIQRHLQGHGIMRLLKAKLIGALQRAGYRRLTITWVSDANAGSLSIVKALGARPVHRLTLYQAEIAPDGTLAASPSNEAMP